MFKTEDLMNRCVKELPTGWRIEVILARPKGVSVYLVDPDDLDHMIPIDNPALPLLQKLRVAVSTAKEIHLMRAQRED